MPFNNHFRSVFTQEKYPPNSPSIYPNIPFLEIGIDGVIQQLENLNQNKVIQQLENLNQNKVIQQLENLNQNKVIQQLENLNQNKVIQQLENLNQNKVIQQLENLNQNKVIQQLENLNQNIATGPDKLPARVLKETAKQIAPIITKSFQKSYGTGNFLTTGFKH